MTETPRPRRRRQSPAGEEAEITEEVVETLRTQGVLSRVLRLPVLPPPLPDGRQPPPLTLDQLFPVPSPSLPPPLSRAPWAAPATAASSSLHSPGASPPPAAAVGNTALRPVGVELRLSDGTRARITPAGLVVGRRRSVAAGTETAISTSTSTSAVALTAGVVAQRLEVDDATRSLSREHARLDEGEDGAVQLVDLGSGNGTTVRHADGTTSELVPGCPVTVSVGDLLQFGDVSATLEPSATRRGGA